jgi:hypothetical protein
MQQVLAYIILLLAVGYLAKKFLLPKSLFTSSKKSTKACGNDTNCGCS